MRSVPVGLIGAGHQALIIWLVAMMVTAIFFLIAASTPGRAWLWTHTGEEAFAAQVKGLTDLAGDRLRPQLDLAPNIPVRYTDVNPFGANVFLEQEADPSKREQIVALAAGAGFGWLRQEFPWEDIEIHAKGDFMDRRHEPNRSAWEKYDQIVDLAQAHNLELIVRLSNPPAWSRSLGDEVGSYAPPDNVQDYADFVHTVVDRYRGRIRFYQIWNEPNIYPEWGVYPVDPEAYTHLLRAGAEAARQADPQVVIIAGALAATINLQPAAAPPGNSLNDMLFLQRMYDAGAAPYFDILAMQGYGLFSGPTDHRMHPRVINFGRAQFMRDLMVQNGDGDKPIWISEMNWNAAPEDVEPRYGRVSLEQQATYLPLAYERMGRDWPWLGVANVWYLKRATDQWEINRQPEAYFRLLAPDFTPQPAFEQLAAYMKQRNQDQGIGE